MFTNFKYIKFYSCPNKRNIFCKRSISIKQLWLEIIEHHFSQLFRVRVVLSRWILHKKCFFRWGTKEMLYIQNWWTIPLIIVFIRHFPAINIKFPKSRGPTPLSSLETTTWSVQPLNLLKGGPEIKAHGRRAISTNKNHGAGSKTATYLSDSKGKTFTRETDCCFPLIFPIFYQKKNKKLNIF